MATFRPCWRLKFNNNLRGTPAYLNRRRCWCAAEGEAKRTNNTCRGLAIKSFTLPNNSVLFVRSATYPCCKPTTAVFIIVRWIKVRTNVYQQRRESL